MKAIILTLGMALGAPMGTTAIAQSKGEADADQAKAVPAQPATKEEKATARAGRITAGKKVAKTATGADDAPNNLGQSKTTSKSDRQAARAKRRAETAAAVKKGEIKSGEQ